MRSLGIRAEPKKVTFVILEGSIDEAKVLNVELIKIPSALELPEQLKYIRNTVLDIIREYNVTVSGIRITEASSKNLNQDRLHIEGVIQEAFSSSSVDNYFTGRMNTISKKLSINLKTYQSLIESGSKFEKLENWDLCKNNISKEAALVGFGAMK